MQLEKYSVWKGKDFGFLDKDEVSTRIQNNHFSPRSRKKSSNSIRNKEIEISVQEEIRFGGQNNDPCYTPGIENFNER